jgi:DNA-binding GntR family transcriptional regulator
VFDRRRPLYQRVAEELSNEIRAGLHPVGSLFPTEAALCTRFRVSRQTIREALRLLGELGLVSRRQGVGTLVERDRVDEQYVQRLGSLPDLSQYVKETRRKVLRVVDVVAAEAALVLPGDPAASWRMLEGLRFLASERTPIAWTQVYVRSAYASVTRERDRDELPLYALIERRHGVKARTVRQEIAGVAIERGVAALLRVPPGSVGLSVRREYVSTSDDIFEVSISIHPADRYRYRMQLDLAYAPPAAAASASRKRG